jgi:heterodisulfide reductase subunit A
VSGTVDFSELKRWAKKHDDIDIAAESNLLCSPAGKKFFSKVIGERKINNIIVAACSPKLHLKTFQDLAEEKNINISRVQMANIREQCAWVTTDTREATEKAKSLIHAAVNRLKHSEDLQKKTLEVNSDVMVIGGGIAGMEVARTMSRAGRKVFLVERNISIGGSVMKTEDLAPNMECSPCLMAPLLSEIRDDENIDVIAHAEIEQVLGFFGNFTVRIRKKPRYVNETCIGCEECFAVCPVSTKNEFHHGLGERKAIYQLFPGQVPPSVVIDRNICLFFKEGTCKKCVPACPFGSIDFEEQEEKITVNVGSLVLATGYSNGRLDEFPELSYGKLDNIFTAYEFESLASSNGPTGGKVTLKDGSDPGTLAVIHCAGSLNEKGISYCSGICCTHAVKVGELIKKQNPAVKVYNIHNDLVFSSPGEFNFYREQIEKGTAFIKCQDLQSVRVSKSEKSGKLTINGNGIYPIDADMVILATGVRPHESVTTLSDMLATERDRYGYLEPDHPLLHATGSELDGIYTAGCASKPANVAESCTQAQAVSGDILSKLIPGREIELEIYTAYVNEEKCAGCKLCLSVCPYRAIYFDSGKNISMVNEAICRGCGTCAAACPGAAIGARDFTDEQIYAEIEGMLNE